MRFAQRVSVELVLFANWKNRGFRRPPPFDAASIIRPRESGAFSYPEGE